MVSVALLLSGCGFDVSEEDTSANSSSTEPTVQIAGAAVKGVIQQGLVVANRLIADKNGYYSPQRQAAKPVLTADDGSYTWQLRGKADGWALVELTADSGTRMLCDVMPACDQPGGETVAFGQSMPVDSRFELRGAGDLKMETVNLTPLTHLAVTLAERDPAGLSPQAISAAYTTVESWFGLPAGALRLTPPDLTNLDQLSDVSADAIQVAVANAAFLALVNNNSQWNSISDVLADATNQIRATGQISVLGDGTNVALADLISTAALQSSELQASVSSSVISQKLVVVEYRNVTRFKTIDEVSGGDTSVVDSGSTTDGTSDTATGGDGTTGSTSGSTTETGTEPGTGSTTGSGTGETATTEPAVPANAALLSWTAPLTRENGESLTMGEIAGYEVVYGTSAENLDQSLAIGDASVDELLVDELAEGTWYFAIRTLDTDGNRSRLSEVVYKQI